jgi:peptidoglycan/xylan/chitin deacetylase (PgdA/CDA1 family)
MKGRVIVLFVLIFCQAASYATENNNLLSVKYEKWFLGNSSAISFMWDDNNFSQYETIAPIFNKYGKKTTVCIITSQLKNEVRHMNGYYNMSSNGHEICSHSVSHARFNTLDQSGKIYELSESKKILDRLFNTNVVGFVHPGNFLDINNIEFDKYYLFSRLSNDKQDSENFIANIDHSTDYKRFLYILSLNKKAKNWINIAGHGVDGNGFEPILSDDLDMFLNDVSTQDVWVDTFSNIALYNEIRLLLSRINKINITDSEIILDDSLIDYTRYEKFGIKSLPITVRIAYPSTSKKIEITPSESIIRIQKHNKYYLVSIDLIKGNIINYKAE